MLGFWDPPLGLKEGPQNLQGPPDHSNFGCWEGESRGWSHGPAGESLPDFQDCSIGVLGDTMLWAQPEVVAETYEAHGDKDNVAGRGVVDAEDGWCPSFPVSVYLANQAEAFRSSSGSAGGHSPNEPSFRLDDSSGGSRLSFVPSPGVAHVAPDPQVDKMFSNPQVEDRLPVVQNTEGRQDALSPLPRWVKTPCSQRAHITLTLKSR